MSTMVQMPVRVNPPPADTGEIISPGCASLEIDHAGERRADDRVERGLRRGVVQARQHLALRDDHALLDVDLDDLAGNFEETVAPPRRHVAGRVQHRGLRAGRPFGHSGRLHLHDARPFDPLPPPATAAARPMTRNDDPAPQRAAARTSRGRARCAAPPDLLQITHAEIIITQIQGGGSGVRGCGGAIGATALSRRSAARREGGCERATGAVRGRRQARPTNITHLPRASSFLKDGDCLQNDIARLC